MKKHKKELKEKVGVFGAGYIGLPLIAAFAGVGYKVMGVDIDKDRVERLKKTYKADIHEPGLNEVFHRCKNSIEFTADHKKAMEECDAIFITVGTPLSKDGRPNFEQLDSVVNLIGNHVRKNQLIVFKSTVLPGVTRKLTADLEKISALKAGEDFHVVFCPERTVEGRALYELHNLPKIIAGINKKSQDRGVGVIGNLGGKIVRVSSLEIAEMCKCIDNTYRVANIAFANEMGEICEKIGIDSYELVKAVNNAYSRTNLFLPGLGAGGPCLSKDPQLLSYFAKQNKVKARMINASIVKNRESNEKIVNIISQFIRKEKIENLNVSILGLAFKGKPETDDIRNALSVDIYRYLKNEFPKIKFNFYDPIVKEFLGEKTCSNIQEACNGANVAVFLTNHQSLQNIDAKSILDCGARPLLIIDCWQNIVNSRAIHGSDDKVKIFRVGNNNHYMN